MAVFAFIEGSSWTTSVLQHAVWAAKQLAQPLTIVTHDESRDSEPVIAYDAYQSMDAHEDMFRELSIRSQTGYEDSDSAAIEIAQNAARKAKELGAERVRTVTTSDPLPWFIENSTDSTDLLVAARHDSSSRDWMDQFLSARKRTILLVPDRFAPVESWMIAIDGKPSIGKAVDFLSTNKLMESIPGTAVIVGNDYQARIHFRDAVRHLQSSGHNMKSHELKGNADDVLAAVLAVAPVDLLVMGAYSQGRFRRLAERSTTSRLLETFRGPVLVARA